jgi:hypothetical protein
MLFTVPYNLQLDILICGDCAFSGKKNLQFNTLIVTFNHVESSAYPSSQPAPGIAALICTAFQPKFLSAEPKYCTIRTPPINCL